MYTKNTLPAPSLFAIARDAAKALWHGIGGAARSEPARPIDESDLQIRGAVLAKLARQPWWEPATSNVFVQDGVVIYQGLLPRRADRSAALSLAQGVPAVRAVRDARVRNRD